MFGGGSVLLLWILWLLAAGERIADFVLFPRSRKRKETSPAATSVPPWQASLERSSYSEMVELEKLVLKC